MSGVLSACDSLYKLLLTNTPRVGNSFNREKWWKRMRVLHVNNIEQNKTQCVKVLLNKGFIYSKLYFNIET